MRYALLAVAVLCAGCTSGLLDSKHPVQQTYVLRAGPAPEAGGEKLAINLSVGRPWVSPGLYTERIAVRHADRRLDYFTGSRWGATSDVVLQSLLVESLRGSGRLSSVQSGLSSFSAQYLLHTEVRDFQADYAEALAPPTIKVSFVCTLGRIRARETVAEYSASAEVRAADNTMSSVIAAFEQAYGQAAQEVVGETLQILTRAEEDRAKAAQ